MRGESVRLLETRQRPVSIERITHQFVIPETDTAYVNERNGADVPREAALSWIFEHHLVLSPLKNGILVRVKADGARSRLEREQYLRLRPGRLFADIAEESASSDSIFNT